MHTAQTRIRRTTSTPVRRTLIANLLHRSSAAGGQRSEYLIENFGSTTESIDGSRVHTCLRESHPLIASASNPWHAW